MLRPCLHRQRPSLCWTSVPRSPLVNLPASRPDIFPTRLIPGSAATLLRMEAVTKSSSFLLHTRTSLTGRLPCPCPPCCLRLGAALSVLSGALSVLCESPSLWGPSRPLGPGAQRQEEAEPCEGRLRQRSSAPSSSATWSSWTAPGRPHPCPVCLHAEPFPLSFPLAVPLVLHHSDASSSLVIIHDDLSGPRPFLVPRTSPQSSSLLPPPTLRTISGADTGASFLFPRNRSSVPASVQPSLIRS